jgi:hypothetical protein
MRLNLQDSGHRVDNCVPEILGCVDGVLEDHERR